MEFDGATGWLVGPPNKGLACMFTMMNEARLSVGVQGVAIGERAYQGALAFAMHPCLVYCRVLLGTPGSHAELRDDQSRPRELNGSRQNPCRMPDPGRRGRL